MDWRDGLHILRFLLEDRLLQVWIPSPTEGVYGKCCGSGTNGPAFGPR
jgi:hypothetical protein